MGVQALPIMKGVMNQDLFLNVCQQCHSVLMPKRTVKMPEAAIDGV
jgi:hypothetical protein